MATMSRAVGAHRYGRAAELRGIWVWSAVAVSATFLVGTFIAEWQQSRDVVLTKLMLTRENNPAALWSGLLLALVAIHAYDGYALWRRSKVGMARAWAGIALLLLILSADEISSVHERVAILGASLGVGVWWPLLPFAVVLVGVLAYAPVLLWQEDGQRGTAILVLLGFFVLSSAALQEFIEHRLVLTSDLARATRAVIEEGSELAGMLLLLKVAVVNTAFADGRGRKAWPCLEAVHELRVSGAVVALLLAPILAVVTAVYAEPAKLGRPADWLAVLLLFGAALAVLRPYLRGEGGRWPAWTLAGTCGCAAVAIVGMEPGRVVWIGPVPASMRLLALGILCPIIVVMWGLLHDRRSMWLYLLGLAVMADLALLALLPIAAAVIYGVTQLLALAIYVAQVSTWQPAGIQADRFEMEHGAAT